MFWNKLFKKHKKVEEKFDFKNYDLKLDVKTICFFEKISKKSFFNFIDEDIPYLIYASFVSNNKINMTFQSFCFLLENEEISKWILQKFKDLFSIIQQFNELNDDNTNTNENENTNSISMTDIATSLIINYGVDASYVMHNMDIWEITSLFQAAENKEHRRLEEERLFTYLNILPHVDVRKLRSPEKLLPFTWEKENKPENRMEKDKKYIDDFIEFWKEKEKENEQ